MQHPHHRATFPARLPAQLLCALLATLPFAAGAACLKYEPAKVTITGTLERRTYPGPPNYEDIKAGDRPETGFYLVPEKPLCADGDKDSETAYPQQKVKLVQLVLNKQQYAKLQPLLGRRLSLSGSLFAQHTGHHRAPLLLQDVALEAGAP